MKKSSAAHPADGMKKSSAAHPANGMKKRHLPIRSCVVCRETSVKRGLLRVVRLPGEARDVAYDPTGKTNGRGAYVCATKECIEKAIKQKRFERSLSVSSVPEGLGSQLIAAIPADDDQIHQIDTIPAGENRREAL